MKFIPFMTLLTSVSVTSLVVVLAKDTPPTFNTASLVASGSGSGSGTMQSRTKAQGSFHFTGGQGQPLPGNVTDSDGHRATPTSAGKYQNFDAPNTSPRGTGSSHGPSQGVDFPTLKMSEGDHGSAKQSGVHVLHHEPSQGSISPAHLGPDRKEAQAPVARPARPRPAAPAPAAPAPAPKGPPTPDHGAADDAFRDMAGMFDAFEKKPDTEKPDMFDTFEDAHSMFDEPEEPKKPDEPEEEDNNGPRGAPLKAKKLKTNSRVEFPGMSANIDEEVIIHEKYPVKPEEKTGTNSNIENRAKGKPKTPPSDDNNKETRKALEEEKIFNFIINSSDRNFIVAETQKALEEGKITSFYHAVRLVAKFQMMKVAKEEYNDLVISTLQNIDDIPASGVVDLVCSMKKEGEEKREIITDYAAQKDLHRNEIVDLIRESVGQKLSVSAAELFHAYVHKSLNPDEDIPENTEGVSVENSDDNEDKDTDGGIVENSDDNEDGDADGSSVEDSDDEDKDTDGSSVEDSDDDEEGERVRSSLLEKHILILNELCNREWYQGNFYKLSASILFEHEEKQAKEFFRNKMISQALEKNYYATKKKDEINIPVAIANVFFECFHLLMQEKENGKENTLKQKLSEEAILKENLEVFYDSLEIFLKGAHNLFTAGLYEPQRYYSIAEILYKKLDAEEDIFALEKDKILTRAGVSKKDFIDRICAMNPSKDKNKKAEEAGVSEDAINGISARQPLQEEDFGTI